MISLRHVTLRRGDRAVLDGASLTINPGEKVALVGRNGAGKSSLFAMLTGHLHEDGGDWSWPRHWRWAQVAQDMPETDQPATDFVVTGDTRLQAAREALRDAEARDDGEDLAHAYTALHDAGDHDARARAQSLLLGLGFALPELDRPVNSFSGGWRMRLQLARALMCPADLLLLDEPTNHLDLDALVWLESWLKRFEGTLLVISHDREFLDTVTQVTVHVDQGRLVRYGGNYSRFEEMRAEQLRQQQAAYARQQLRLAQLQRFVDRFKAKATKARQAQSRVKAMERMERLAPVLADADFDFEFADPGALPNPLITLRDAAFGYHGPDGAAPHVVVSAVSRSVMAGQRIGVLGANGQGKSTVIKTLAGVLPLISGRLQQGKGLRIGYFAQQELDLLRPDDTPLQHMIRLAREAGADGSLAGQPTREQDLRTYLGSFQFSADKVNQAVGSMSGGEKARLVLCMIVWQRPNLLLLDEPTNHLDLATREALGVALNGFEGTVMLVSHDRALLDAVCEEFWLVSHGGIETFEGDLQDYQRHLLDLARQRRDSLQAMAAPAAAPAAAEATRLNPAQQRRLDAQRREQLAERTRPLRRQIASLDEQLARLDAESRALHDRLLGALPAAELADAGRRLKAIDSERTAAEERWLELSEQLEQAENTESS